MGFTNQVVYLFFSKSSPSTNKDFKQKVIETFIRMYYLKFFILFYQYFRYN